MRRISVRSIGRRSGGNADGFDYGRVLRELAGRADSAISYDDLQRRKDALLAIPESDRKKLAKQVKALYDVSSMGGGFGSRSSDCTSLLESSDGSSFSFFTKNELNEAAKKIKDSWTFSSTEAEALVERAAKWGIDWAADGDEKKRNFLKEIEEGKGQRFLSEALEAYKKLGNNSDLSGRSGYRIGSDSYMHALERDVFDCNIPSSYGADWGNPQYEKLLREALQEIASQIQNNLEEAQRNNWYMRDENAEHMREGNSQSGKVRNQHVFLCRNCRQALVVRGRRQLQNPAAPAEAERNGRSRPSDGGRRLRQENTQCVAGFSG